MRRTTGGGEGGGGGRGGGEETDIKSNNPHLTGGEKHKPINLAILRKPHPCEMVVQVTLSNLDQPEDWGFLKKVTALNHMDSILFRRNHLNKSRSESQG